MKSEITSRILATGIATLVATTALAAYPRSARKRLNFESRYPTGIG